MIHRVVLSNKRVLLVVERDKEISIATESEGSEGFESDIATESEGFESDVDAYICQIDASGVLVMPNSGDATHYITEGLKS